jgi:F-box protein 9
MNSAEAELESFRQKWREEVSAKTKGKQPAVAVPAKTTPASSSRAQGHASKSDAPEVAANVWAGSEEVDEVQPYVHQQLGEKQHGRRLDETSAQAAAASSNKEPKSALEHYERAVERENQGILGDSLSLYRKAFKVRTIYPRFS